MPIASLVRPGARGGALAAAVAATFALPSPAHAFPGSPSAFAIKHVSSGTCVAAPAEAGDDGGGGGGIPWWQNRLVHQNCDGGTTQRWVYRADDQTLRSVARPGQCVTPVAPPHGLPHQLALRPCESGAGAQKWRSSLRSAGNAGEHVQPAGDAGYAWQGTSLSGAVQYLGAWDRAEAQQWTFPTGS
ncbi:ricin-type beta-trefoil lectin domain protein [Streptomyces cinnamoneus]|uniref:ricin-type beta-trefoil lectin domain protein n=1 Tax=Streptomyces cinnamoneus TaxID=53446 RepID=UPI00379C6843